MGRALKAVRTRDLEGLFAFFGVEARPELLEACRAAVAARFTLEVQEIVRLCPNLHERERHKLFREALRLAYESSVGDVAGPRGWPRRELGPDGPAAIHAR